MKLRIEQDPNAPNPREAGHLFGKIVHWHPRRNLGERVDDREAGRAAMSPGAIRLPISLFDHSCVRLWVGILPFWSDPRGGDSGHVGYIYATPEDIAKYFKGGDAADTSLARKVRHMLHDEIKDFDQYLRGDVWKYIVENNAGNRLDSRGGFLYREDAESEGQEALARAEA